MLGKTDAELFPAEEADRLTQIKARVLVDRRWFAAGNFPRRRAGEKHFYDLTVEPVRDALGQITGITGAAMEVTERKRLEEEILQISEMEQRRIGQDLHDGICQHLAGIELKSQSLAEIAGEESQGPGGPGRSKSPRHVRDVIAQTRSLARGLSPFILEAEGWVSALAGIGRAHARNCSMSSVNFQSDGAGVDCRPGRGHPSLSHRPGSGRPTPSNTAKPARLKSV